MPDMDDKRMRFEAQVLPHLDAAYRFARWLSYSGTDVEDVVQEAILRAYRGFAAVRGTDVKGWLMTIVRNCHLTAAAQRQRHPTLPLPSPDDAEDGDAMISAAPDPEELALRHDERRTFDRLLASLPEEHRTVLVLREIEEMDYRQIAAITNVPIGTVMSRLARSRAALKEKWLQQNRETPRAVP
jgi:RNA polymerase sigma-70 factor (ECF subfamily)